MDCVRLVGQGGFGRGQDGVFAVVDEQAGHADDGFHALILGERGAKVCPWRVPIEVEHRGYGGGSDDGDLKAQNDHRQQP